MLLEMPGGEVYTGGIWNFLKDKQKLDIQKNVLRILFNVMNSFTNKLAI